MVPAMVAALTHILTRIHENAPFKKVCHVYAEGSAYALNITLSRYKEPKLHTILSKQHLLSLCTIRLPTNPIKNPPQLGLGIFPLSRRHTCRLERRRLRLK